MALFQSDSIGWKKGIVSQTHIGLYGEELKRNLAVQLQNGERRDQLISALRERRRKNISSRHSNTARARIP